MLTHIRLLRIFLKRLRVRICVSKVRHQVYFFIRRFWDRIFRCVIAVIRLLYSELFLIASVCLIKIVFIIFIKVNISWAITEVITKIWMTWTFRGVIIMCLSIIEQYVWKFRAFYDLEIFFITSKSFTFFNKRIICKIIIMNFLSIMFMCKCVSFCKSILKFKSALSLDLKLEQVFIFNAEYFLCMIKIFRNSFPGIQSFNDWLLDFFFHVNIFLH